MRDKESALDVTTIGVSPVVEDLFVEVDVSDVDGVIEGESDHLRYSGAPVILWTQVSGHLGTILRAEAVRQSAESLVTLGSTVRISVSI